MFETGNMLIKTFKDILVKYRDKMPSGELSGTLFPIF